MKDRIKSAFDGIHAEEQLKEDTKRYLSQKRLVDVYDTAGDTRRQRRARTRWLAAALVCMLVIATGMFSYGAYYAEAAYIDLDINPSISLTINRFNRVIGASAYNEDGRELLAIIDLKHKTVDEALSRIIDGTALQGSLQDEGLVCVTVQSVTVDEAWLLNRVQSDVQESVSHHANAEVDVFPVDADVRSSASDLYISPAKYLAIKELQSLDPDISLDECIHHNVSEIRELIHEHCETTVEEPEVEYPEVNTPEVEYQPGHHHGHDGH